MSKTIGNNIIYDCVLFHVAFSFCSCLFGRFRVSVVLCLFPFAFAVHSGSGTGRHTAGRKQKKAHTPNDEETHGGKRGGEKRRREEKWISRSTIGVSHHTSPMDMNHRLHDGVQHTVINTQRTDWPRVSYAAAFFNVLSLLFSLSRQL